LEIEEFRLDSVWYSLDYGATVLPLSTPTGIIDQLEWNKFGSGTVPIRFYANDSLGHESSVNVIVIKDVTLPQITINTPYTGLVIGHDSPEYDISIAESNLDSYWYSLDGGLTNITLTSLTGELSQAEWDKYGNGTVNIWFYARDQGGNVGFKEIRIRKDINIPLISIVSPRTDEICGFHAPRFEISVVEPNIDIMWYTLDGGTTTYSFTDLTGYIDEVEWDKHDHGMVSIHFYVRDEGGNEAYTEVQVEKDLITPVITIIAPQIGASFEEFTPIYSISIEETNLDSYWYSLDGGITNMIISTLNGVIDESAWNTIPNGHLTLTFYAKDKGGNIGQSSVLITKNSPEEPQPIASPAIPGYDLSLIIGVISVISIIIIRKRLKS
jgi:hypothetical protein